MFPNLAGIRGVAGAGTLVSVMSLSSWSCGGGNGASPTMPTTNVTLHGEVSKPAGGAIPDPRVPISPNLIFASVDVTNGVVTLKVQLAPGTLNRDTTFVEFLLDTDRNPATGYAGVGVNHDDRDILGVDQDIQLGPGSTYFRTQCAGPTSASCTNFSLPNPPIYGADQIELSLPLASLNTDGRMNFKVVAQSAIPGILIPIVSDYLPNLGLPPGQVR